MGFDQDLTKNLSRRVGVFYCGVLLVFLVILVRLWDLQLFRGAYFFDLSENNRIKTREIAAPRGNVFDRNGRALITNTPSFDVSLLQEGVKGLDAALPLLSSILNLTPSDIRARVQAGARGPRLRPVKIKTDVSREELALIEFYKLELPNVVVDVFPKRFYPLGVGAAHLLGYLGKVEECDLGGGRNDQAVGDYIGKAGVERVFEPQLRGRPGLLQFEVDAAGKKKRILNSFPPAPGGDVVLTIDADLQLFAHQALGEHPGAIVVLDPNNGDVLALVSHPSFDPNLFSRGISARAWSSLITAPGCPLTNKTIHGQYPPGSLFKVVTASAALEEEVITPETPLSCTGSFFFGNRPYRCWKKGGHGHLCLRRAIEESCDVFFYILGQKLGIDRLSHYATLFGLGAPTGIILPDERPGLVPTRKWKLKTMNVPWQEGETVSSSIGQSFTLVTPLQVASLFSTIANGGRLYRPRLIKSAATSEQTTPPASQIPISPAVLAFVRDSLRGVIQSPGGTGRGVRIEGLVMGGKTATAQVVSLPADPSADRLVPLRFRDHAWFAAFAPFNNPVIVVVVLVEHGGFGSETAGPVVKEIVSFYLSHLIKKRNVDG